MRQSLSMTVYESYSMIHPYCVCVSVAPTCHVVHVRAVVGAAAGVVGTESLQ